MEPSRPNQKESPPGSNGDVYMPYEVTEGVESDGDKADSPREETEETPGDPVEIEQIFKHGEGEAVTMEGEAVKAPADTHPMVSKLLEENCVFQRFPVLKDTPQQRESFPCKRDPNARINVWELLKNSVGKDISRIAMPVYLNDPVSMLQKIAELLEFADFLRLANECTDPHLRLVYIAAFFFAVNPYTIPRLKKPFNPILGETFEFSQGGIHFIAEQVSHHPPISAFYCESPDFTFEGYYNLKSAISMSGFVVTPKGPFTLKLRRTNETFSFTKPQTSVHNLIMGTTYIWHYGDSTLVNQTTGDRLLLNFKPKGWTSARDYEVDGRVTDSSGAEKLKLFGKWNSFLSIVLPGGEEKRIFSAPPLPPEAAENYFFSKFVLNLNHLPPSLLSDLPPTDTRLRPDQRAYEFGDLKLATEEKHRLEENQRRRRAAAEAAKRPHTPMWFYVTTSNGKDPTFSYNGKYFPLKEARAWPKNIPDLFG